MAESLLVSWAILWVAGLLLCMSIWYAIRTHKLKQLIRARLEKERLEKEKAQLNN